MLSLTGGRLVIHLLTRARLQALSFEKSSTVVLFSSKPYLIFVTLQGDSAQSYQVYTLERNEIDISKPIHCTVHDPSWKLSFSAGQDIRRYYGTRRFKIPPPHTTLSQ
jgi:hypothetical protein